MTTGGSVSGGAQAPVGVSGNACRPEEMASSEISVGFTRELDVLGVTSICLPEAGSTMAMRLLGAAAGLSSGAGGGAAGGGAPAGAAAAGTSGTAAGAAAGAGAGAGGTPSDGGAEAGFADGARPGVAAPEEATGEGGGWPRLPAARPRLDPGGVFGGFLGVSGSSVSNSGSPSSPLSMHTRWCSPRGLSSCRSISRPALNLSSCSLPKMLATFCASARSCGMVTSAHCSRPRAKAFSRSLACKRWYFNAISVSFTWSKW